MLNKLSLWIRGKNKEMWEVFNIIFTAGGIVTLLFGSSLLGVIIWITRKPKVYALSQPNASWFYTFKDGKYHSEINIEVFIDLINKGKEKTNINAFFETENTDHCIFNLISDLKVELGSNCKISRLFLQLPFHKLLQEGYKLNGTLKIKPSNNRRLLIFGKKYLKFKLQVSEDQGKIYDYGNRNN
jgi:hypothetical protein